MGEKLKAFADLFYGKRLYKDLAEGELAEIDALQAACQEVAELEEKAERLERIVNEIAKQVATEWLHAIEQELKANATNGGSVEPSNPKVSEICLGH